MKRAARAAAWIIGVLFLIGLIVAATAWVSAPFATKLFETVEGRNKPVPPVRIADNFYYVGSDDIASYLVVGDKGLVLIDGGFEDMAPQILANIRSLGFDPRDVKIILNTHGHYDHAAGIAALKRATGAALYASPLEKTLLEAGGRGDFYYGDHLAYEPVKVDRVLTDGETVRLGNVALTAQFTPGHTKGCTSWEIPLTIGGKPTPALLICSLSLVGSPLRGDPNYPGIAADFENSFARLKRLPCQILLVSHARLFGLAAKSRALAQGDKRAFVDPAGCAQFIRGKENEFHARLGR